MHVWLLALSARQLPAWSCWSPVCRWLKKQTCFQGKREGPGCSHAARHPVRPAVLCKTAVMLLSCLRLKADLFGASGFAKESLLPVEVSKCNLTGSLLAKSVRPRSVGYFPTDSGSAETEPVTTKSGFQFDDGMSCIWGLRLSIMLFTAVLCPL